MCIRDSIPTEYGGLGLNIMECAIVLEELSSVWFSASTNAMTLLTGPLLAFGTEEQKQKYLPAIVSGDILTAFALTEPDAGSDASSIQSFARKDGDDWVINGRKIYITNGARADLIVLFARTDKTAPRGEGISLFLIEKGTPGFSVGQSYDMLAHTANPVAELVFDECRVPNSCILGKPGGGFKYMQVGFSKARATYGARCASVAQAALNYALNYMQTREQFGQPLASFQALRFRTAELYAKIEAARQSSRDLRRHLRAGFAISEPPTYLFSSKLSPLAGPGAPKAVADRVKLDKALRAEGFKLVGEPRSLFDALSHQLCGTHQLSRYVEHAVATELRVVEAGAEITPSTRRGSLVDFHRKTTAAAPPSTSRSSTGPSTGRPTRRCPTRASGATTSSGAGARTTATRRRASATTTARPVRRSRRRSKRATSSTSPRRTAAVSSSARSRAATRVPCS